MSEYDYDMVETRKRKYGAKPKRSPRKSTGKRKARAAIPRPRKRARTGRAGVQSNDQGSGGEFTKSSATWGRLTKERLPMAVRANLQMVLAKVQSVNGFANSPAMPTSLPGAVSLANINITNTSTYTQLPLVLFDVTSWFNNVAGSLQFATPGWAMQTEASGKISWYQIGPAWGIEESEVNLSGGTADSGLPPGDADVIKWVKFKMLGYGRTAYSTRYDVDVISLKHDHLSPEYQAQFGGITLGVGASQTNENLTQEHSTFWASCVRPYTFSPLLTGSRKAQTKMKVHMHRSWTTQPSLTNEPTATQYAGHMHQFDLTLNLNRISRYDWNTKAVLTQPQLETAAFVGSDVGQPTTVVHPTKRVYIMIRAQSRYSVAATVDPQIHPSFDFSMRSMHEKV